MDPNETWNNLLEALKQKQWDRAKEFADALHEWIWKRGCPPTTVGDESLGPTWHRTIASFVCLHVANKVHGINQRRQQREDKQEEE